MRIIWWATMAALLVAHGVLGFDAPDFAFLLTAEANADASGLVISWPKKDVRSITIRRKLAHEKKWGPPIARLAGNATQFVDREILKGVRYEYQFSGPLKDHDEEGFEATDPLAADVEASDPAPSAFGYICAGIEAPAIETRGKLALIVDQRFAGELTSELETLRNDLIGDGWSVVRHDVPVDASPKTIKSWIKAEYEKDPAAMRAVFLLGHIPVPYSGLLNPDMHSEHLGAWPADVYYGEMDGEWTDESVHKEDSEFAENDNVPGDGKFDQSEIPGTVELEVGRVDMWYLAVFEPRTELELLRNYLRKNHAYRHGLLRAEPRGLIRDNFGVVQDDAPAADAWRAFPALFGPKGWTEVGPDEFFPTLASESYTFAFGAGGGDRDKADGVGWSQDFATTNPKALFYLLHGSYFGDWNTADNFLRAATASDDYGLVSIWCSLPHWYFHHLGMGETFGFATRLVQNNRDGLYQNDPNYSVGQVHISMMGDPTLRTFVIAPPSNLKLFVAEKVALTWDAPSGLVVGYNVYSAATYDAPFRKLNSKLITDTRFESDLPPSGPQVYQVKAVALQTTGSGTFWNMSQGSFVETMVDTEIPPAILTPTLTAFGRFAFEAKGFPERAYAVESRSPDGLWRVRATGTSTGDGAITYEETLSENPVCELYRVRWD